MGRWSSHPQLFQPQQPATPRPATLPLLAPVSGSGDVRCHRHPLAGFQSPVPGISGKPPPAAGWTLQSGSAPEVLSSPSLFLLAQRHLKLLNNSSFCCCSWVVGFVADAARQLIRSRYLQLFTGFLQERPCKQPRMLFWASSPSMSRGRETPCIEKFNRSPATVGVEIYCQRR